MYIKMKMTAEGQLKLYGIKYLQGKIYTEDSMLLEV